MRRIVILSLLCISISSCNDKGEPDRTNMFLTAYPNPFLERGNIHVVNSSPQDAALKVFDPKGEIILEETVKPGDHTYSFDAQNNATGKYQVVYKLGSTAYTAELIRI